MSTRRERRERTRPLAKAAFPILDEYQEEDWELRKAGEDPLDDQAAAARDANFLARLLLACGNDSAVLADVVVVWYETRRKPSDARGDEDRANHYPRFLSQAREQLRQSVWTLS